VGQDRADAGPGDFHFLRDAYRTSSGEEHSNWEEYDQAMRDDRRSVIIVVPERIYGTAA